jgi:hypothetical protein
MFWYHFTHTPIAIPTRVFMERWGAQMRTTEFACHNLHENVQELLRVSDRTTSQDVNSIDKNKEVLMRVLSFNELIFSSHLRCVLEDNVSSITSGISPTRLLNVVPKLAALVNGHCCILAHSRKLFGKLQNPLIQKPRNRSCHFDS